MLTQTIASIARWYARRRLPDPQGKSAGTLVSQLLAGAAIVALFCAGVAAGVL